MSRIFAPAICMVALASMIAAGASHWWSVRQLVGMWDALPEPSQTMAAGRAVAEMPEIPAPIAPEMMVAETPLPASPPVGEPIEMQQQFYQELIREMQQLRDQNRQLLNQVAETNRDLMKLEFRVDTHSEQFRPLPVSDDNFGTTFGTSFDETPGLLPPRAEPVVLPFSE